MIDYFALTLAHVLILIALWRLSGDDRLDNDPAFPAPRRDLGRNVNREPSVKQPREGGRDA